MCLCGDIFSRYILGCISKKFNQQDKSHYSSLANAYETVSGALCPIWGSADEERQCWTLLEGAQGGAAQEVQEKTERTVFVQS